MDHIQQYKQKLALSARCTESARIMKKYPDRCPVICGHANTANANQLRIRRNKFLVPRDLAMSQLLHVFRRHMRTQDETKAVCYFIGDSNYMVDTSKLVCDVYRDHVDEDGHLYITFTEESTFGCSSESLMDF